MDGPGLSLFQGSESIQLNTSAQRLEEDEEQEDNKRRNEEIKNLLTTAFDDLEDDDEDDDVSSVNSSHFQDSTKDNDYTNTGNVSLQPSSNKDLSQYQKEFDVYNYVDKSHMSYDNNSLTNHRIESDIHKSMPDVQREFVIHTQTVTPYNRCNNTNDVDNTTIETPYELARPPILRVGQDVPRHISEGYTFNENSPYHFETPANHYDGQSKKFPNNGFIGRYKEVNSNVPRQDNELGGGDSISSGHLNHCYKTSPNGRPVSDNVAYKTVEYGSKEELEVLYAVRIKEIQKLTDKLQQLQCKKEEEKAHLSRQLALLQAEIERSNLSRNQAQHALVDAKAEIASIEVEVVSLKEKNAVLQKSNLNMTEELNVARASVIDLQQKIAVLERVQALQSTDKTHEKFLKEAQEKHAVEIRNMQIQIDLLTEKLNTKETAYTTLENKLVDVRRAHESLMVEKGDTMNKLAQALEESQSQCRNLMATNNAQHVVQLQTQLKILSQEKDDMYKTVQDLQNKLEVAKSDVAQYDSLLATTLEEESDSIKQMKLGDFQKHKSKPSDDIANKLRSELQRCLAAQAVKRKEINRLENTLAKKEKEIEKALEVANTCRQEAAQYCRRVNELEHELKSVLTDEAMKANAQIQKLHKHLNDVKKQCEVLREEKLILEQKLEESRAINQEMLERLNEEPNSLQETTSVREYNKEYLEIHEKAVERVRQQAQIEMVQMSVQLGQTQKELDRVKELYIDVCGRKEELINDHKNEIRMLKERYGNLEERQNEMDKIELQLQTQIKITDKLTKEYEICRSKTVELEKDLSCERRKKEEYTKKIHNEIEKAKEEALRELRNAHPNQEISVFLPDHCSEHLEKINHLEADCKRLEEKLHVAVEEHQKMTQYQTELDDARLKIAQLEISQESWKKKYDNVLYERNDLRAKISKVNSEVSSKIEDAKNVNLKITHCEMEDDGLKSKYDNLLIDRNSCKAKIIHLESQLRETKSIITNLENKIKRNNEGSLNLKCELEKEALQYKDMIVQLTAKVNMLKEGKKNDFSLEQKVKQLEKDLQNKDEKLQRLKDFEKIKDERDQLVLKLKNQAKQFEQYVKSQKQVSAELNLSPRNSSDGTDFQKMKEMMIKEVREGMEQKVIEELRGIEEQHQDKRKELEEKYKTVLLEIQTKCNEKTQEVEALKDVMVAEKVKIHSSFKAKEQVLSQVIESKLAMYYKELLARKFKIEKLQEALQQKENDVEEERNLMAQVMTKWAEEIREIKAKEVETNNEMEKLRQIEENLKSEVKLMQDKEREMKNIVDTLKHKYQSAKKIANNYKEHAGNKEKFLLSECKRIEEGYKRAMNQVQQKLDDIVSTQEEQVATKLKELECHYAEKMEQMRLTRQYKML